MSVKDNSAENNNIFDPMKDLFMAQSSRPSHLRRVNMRTLTPFQRALMVIDGTVTKFIEAYTMEPVQVTRLSQSVRPLEEDHPWLEVGKDSPVTIREVLLRGEYSHTDYAYAVSLIVHEELNNSVHNGLSSEGSSLGRLLQGSRLETYREILWYGRQRFENLPNPINYLNDSEFLCRTYRIISGGKPIMMINENFPLYSGDQSPAHH
jgi:chorismate-pyruvate lyase